MVMHRFNDRIREGLGRIVDAGALRLPEGGKAPRLAAGS
jgi:hypothetical protein